MIQESYDQLAIKIRDRMRAVLHSRYKHKKIIQKNSFDDKLRVFMNLPENETGMNDGLSYENKSFNLVLREGGTSESAIFRLDNDIELSKVTELQLLPSKSIEERKMLFFNYVEESGLNYEKIPNKLQFVVFTMCYWYKHTKLVLNRCHLYALLLSFIRCHIIDGEIDGLWDEHDLQIMLKKLPSLEKSYQSANAMHANVDTILRYPNKAHFAQAALNLLPHTLHNKSTAKMLERRQLPHALSEYQVCYMFLYALNNFAGNPFHSLSIDRILHCPLFCNMLDALVTSKNENIFLCQMFEECDQVKKILQELQSCCANAVNFPDVLDLFPKKSVNIKKDGTQSISYHLKKPLNIALRDEKVRLKEKMELEIIDSLVKEFEQMGSEKPLKKHNPRKKTHKK